jgi:hypothetical protein
MALASHPLNDLNDLNHLFNRIHINPSNRLSNQQPSNPLPQPSSPDLLAHLLLNLPSPPKAIARRSPLLPRSIQRVKNTVE